jgi:molybdopterin converting factor subunit 1
MIVKVRMFAVAKQAAGAAEVQVELPEGTTVAQLRSSIQSQYPQLADLGDRLLFSLDAEYAPDSQLISEGADIACIPPVSGG